MSVSVHPLLNILTVVALCAAPAAVAAAPAKGKKPPAAISIENGRQVPLTTFEITQMEAEPKPGAKAKPPGKPVLKLAKPLEPGEKKLVKLTGARGCSYLARWKFEDAGDEGPIDICGDPKIVLTD